MHTVVSLSCSHFQFLTPNRVACKWSNLEVRIAWEKIGNLINKSVTGTCTCTQVFASIQTSRSLSEKMVLPADWFQDEPNCPPGVNSFTLACDGPSLSYVEFPFRSHLSLQVTSKCRPPWRPLGGADSFWRGTQHSSGRGQSKWWNDCRWTIRNNQCRYCM